MNVRGTLWFLVFVVAAMSGCADSGGPEDVEASASTSAAVTDDATGAVAGVVVDEEELPVVGADVLVAKTQIMTKTDDQGRFTMTQLQPGKIVLLVQRLGYEQTTLAVDVIASETVEVRIPLKAYVVPDEPYHVSVPKTGHIVFGNALLTTIWYQGVNQSAYNQLVCDPCRFTLYMDPGPADILVEPIWNAGTGAGYINNEIFVNYLTKGTDAEYSDTYWLYYGYHKNRQPVHWPEAQLKKVTKMDQLRLWLRPDLDGASVDHTVTTWTTFGYNGVLPPTFTALPPP